MKFRFDATALFQGIIELPLKSPATAEDWQIAEKEIRSCVAEAFKNKNIDCKQVLITNVFEHNEAQNVHPLRMVNQPTNWEK